MRDFLSIFGRRSFRPNSRGPTSVKKNKKKKAALLYSYALCDHLSLFSFFCFFFVLRNDSLVTALTVGSSRDVYYRNRDKWRPFCYIGRFEELDWTGRRSGRAMKRTPFIMAPIVVTLVVMGAIFA